MTVHPRMRGERHFFRMELKVSNRFIPACAGNAGVGLWLRINPPVHPRMRGERSKPAIKCRARVGSSPHARGTPDLDTQKIINYRFIPACAGNAHARGIISRGTTVHPRMRGER